MKSALFLETIEEAKQVKKLIDTRDKNIIYLIKVLMINNSFTL